MKRLIQQNQTSSVSGSDEIVSIKVNSRDDYTSILRKYSLLKYDDVVIRDPFFFCVGCGTILILPPWFEHKFRAMKRDPRLFLAKYVNCCDITSRLGERTIRKTVPHIRYLVEPMDIHKDDPCNTDVFQPYLTQLVLIIPDVFIKTNMVVDEFIE